MRLKYLRSSKSLVVVLAVVFSTSATAQETAHGTAVAPATSQNEPPQLEPGWGYGGLPVDWSFTHIIHTAHSSKSQIEQMQNEPRAYYQWLVQGHKPGSGQSNATLASGAATIKAARNRRPAKPHRDWSLSLGSGTLAQNMSPAKFNFSINQTPNCTNDFVVYGLNVASSATQANLVGVNNLYSGTSPTGLCGTAPTVYWAYRASTAGGKITTSPILSLDGTKVAFVESTGSQSILHVLAWKATNGTVTSPIVPTTVTSVGGCTTPCMSSLTYDSTHGTTLSSPFYDYQASTDTLWVGNDNGQLFQITGVFLGTPTVSNSGGWSTSGVSVAAAGAKMTGPVLDFNSGKLFVGGSDGNLYSVSSTAPGTQSHIAVGSGNANGGGIVDPPTIDSSSGTVIAYAAANAANVGGTSLAANTTAVVVQATTSLGSPRAATIGQGSLGSTANLNVDAGSFDNNYFNWSGSGANTGHFYAIGTASGATSPTLYQIPYSGVASLTLNTNGAGYTTPTVSFSGGSGSGATATASGGVTGVSVSAAGSGYTSVPSVSYATAPAGGTTASGSTVSVGVSAISVASGGSGYTSLPSVTFSPTGGGASATASLGVGSISVTGAGCYSSTPTVTISGGGGSGASATANLGGSCDVFFQTVTSVTVTAPGSGYTSVPTVSFSTGIFGGNTATGTASLKVASVAVGTAGTYTTFPTASISGGGGSGTVLATTANVAGVSAPTTPGSGYTSAPSVTFSGGGGSGAAATSTINVTNLALTFGGGGYSSSPSVTISGGSTNATATATINAGTVMTPGTSTTTFTVNGTAAVQGSPVTEIFTNASTDLLFYGYGGGSVGEIASQNVTGGSISAPTLLAEPAATGGTSAIVVDNISASAQASSIYFATQATSSNCGSGVFCAVKLTQTGLQ